MVNPSAAEFARAVSQLSLHLAVFDVAIRERTGQWHLEARVPLEGVIDRFAEVETTQLADGRILLPLHETGSADLTDEAVIADPTVTPPRIEFYDFSAGTRVQRPIDELAQTIIGWRLRFWSDAYEPIDPPEYLDESASCEEKRSAPRTVAGHRTDEREWFEQVRSALVAERDTRRSARRGTYQTGGPDHRTPGGEVLTGLECVDRRVDDFGQHIVTLALSDDHDSPTTDAAEMTASQLLSPGDDILVTAAEADALPVEASLFEVEDDRIDLGIYWDTAAGEGVEAAFTPGVETRFGIAQLIEATPYTTVEDALRSLERRERGAAVYAGTADIRFGQSVDLPSSDWLNRDQRRAVERALAAEDVCCVHVPPWTGGKRTIHAIVAGSVSAGRTVGVFAPTDDAIAHVESAVTNGPSPSLYDGTEIRYAQLGGRAGNHGDPWQADVVGISLEGAIDAVDLTFDVGVVDQAARIDVARAAIPFAEADRLILLGDPRQLPPQTPLTGRTAALPRSVFEHVASAYGDDATARLRGQYNMNQAITMYPNARYYDGRLIHGQRNRTWTVDTMAPLVPRAVAGEPRQTPTGSWYVEAEVATVVREIESVTQRGVPSAEIAVIAPTSAQVGKIRAALEEELPTSAPGIAVGGPAQFACSARDVAIVSLVADPDGGHRWSHEELNVALTRARRRLVIVAQWDRLSASDRSNGTPATVELCEFLSERGLLGGNR